MCSKLFNVNCYSDAYNFETEILTSTGSYTYHFLTGWFFLMKRGWHFSTKLNTRDKLFKNVIVFGYLLVICSPLLTKQYFPHQG